MSADGSRRPDSGPDEVVVRKVDHGWVVGGENVSDLTSAMVLADLFAADHATGDDTKPAAAGERTAPAVSNAGAANHGNEADEAARLAVTVTQLERALASRVHVEQAIGVLA